MNPAGNAPNPFGAPVGAAQPPVESAFPQRVPPQQDLGPNAFAGHPPAAAPLNPVGGQGHGGSDRYGTGNSNGIGFDPGSGHGNGDGTGYDPGSGNGNRDGTGYDPGAGNRNGHGNGYDPRSGIGNARDRQFTVDRPFSPGDPAADRAGHSGAQPVPSAQPQDNFPQNGFPPFAPPMPNGGPPASTSTPRHPAHPNGSPVPTRPRILVQEFNGHRCAEVDPLTGSLHEAAEPMAPFSGVYGDLDGVEFVFFRTDDRLFLRMAGQLIDADDLAVIVHWQRAGRRHTEFTVTRAGLAVCTVRYRRRNPELDLGLWIRDVLDNPARRTQIFAEVRGVR